MMQTVPSVEQSQPPVVPTTPGVIYQGKVEIIVRCTDACGTTSENPEHEGWQSLEITNRWRCVACMQALMRVNGRV